MNKDEMASGGATGLFGTVARGPVEKQEPVREEVPEPVKESAKEPVRPPVVTSPVVTAPPTTAASGGFTQLLRALNYDQVRDQVQRESAKTEPALGASVQVPVEGRPVRERPQPVATPHAREAVPEKAAASVGSSQVTSFLPKATSGVASAPVSIASVPALPMAAVAPVEAPGSFTQMFQRLETEPAPVDVAAGTKGSAPSEPGSFTQLFTVPEQPRESAPEAKVMLPPTAYAPEPTVTPVANAPGSFTQMFQTLGEPAAEAVPTGAEPTRAAEPAGSFTQMFQALESPAAETVSHQPESFGESARTSAQPGSFTQMFAGMLPSPPIEATQRSRERTYATSAPEQGNAGASQVFSTFHEPTVEPRAEVRGERGPLFSSVEPSRSGLVPEVGTSASGGLTQLLRTLDQPVKSGQPYVPPSLTPQPDAARAGSFTGVYGELDAATPAPVARPPVEAVSPVTPMPVAAPVVAGPSEFTRLINASALREAGLRGGGAAATPTHAAPAGASVSAPLQGMGSFSVTPPTLPGVGGSSFSTPHLPGGASASVSTPGLHAPQLPRVTLPAAPKMAVAPTGLQKFVPLLLILVIFLLAAILVAVVVLMKK